MAKMFYTLEEAAVRLGQSEADVRQMAQSGRIQEFRDRDRLMFKVDQIDLIAAGEGGDEADMSSVIPLADSVGGPVVPMEASGAASFGGDKIDIAAESGPSLAGSGIGLAASRGGSAAGSRAGSRGGSGSGVADPENPKQRSGVSIFDADELESADPAAVTHVTSGGVDDLALEPVGSGSGLMELTRESDDTSLGAVDFLQEVSAGDEKTGEAPLGASGLFGGAGEEVEQAAAVGAPGAAPMVLLAEPFDGAGSGLVGGLSIGVLAALALATAVVLAGLMNAGGVDSLTGLVAGNFWIWVGGLAGLTAVAGVVGLMLGKRG